MGEVDDGNGDGVDDLGIRGGQDIGGDGLQVLVYLGFETYGGGDVISVNLGFDVLFMKIAVGDRGVEVDKDPGGEGSFQVLKEPTGGFVKEVVLLDSAVRLPNVTKQVVVAQEKEFSQQIVHEGENDVVAIDMKVVVFDIAGEFGLSGGCC